MIVQLAPVLSAYFEVVERDLGVYVIGTRQLLTLLGVPIVATVGQSSAVDDKLPVLLEYVGLGSKGLEVLELVLLLPRTQLHIIDLDTHGRFITLEVNRIGIGVHEPGVIGLGRADGIGTGIGGDERCNWNVHWLSLLLRQSDVSNPPVLKKRGLHGTDPGAGAELAVTRIGAQLEQLAHTLVAVDGGLRFAFHRLVHEVGEQVPGPLEHVSINELKMVDIVLLSDKLKLGGGHAPCHYALCIGHILGRGEFGEILLELHTRKVVGLHGGVYQNLGDEQIVHQTQLRLALEVLRLPVWKQLVSHARRVQGVHVERDTAPRVPPREIEGPRTSNHPCMTT